MQEYVCQVYKVKTVMNDRLLYNANKWLNESETIKSASKMSTLKRRSFLRSKPAKNELYVAGRAK